MHLCSPAKQTELNKKRKRKKSADSFVGNCFGDHASKEALQSEPGFFYIYIKYANKGKQKKKGLDCKDV